jgi:ABC-type nitrate/sulfonate/bicarbonate transport system ATPase subunit
VETYKGKVGMVPQNYWMPEYLNVQQHLALAGKQGGLTQGAVQREVRPLRQLFGLGDHLKMYPNELSGGTRQRVAIARQMMCVGHYLVHGRAVQRSRPDHESQGEEAITTLASLDELNTIIIVTHDISEGMSVADTVWLMGYDNRAATGEFPGRPDCGAYDLAAEDLCWRPDIQSEPRFLEFVGEVKARFQDTEVNMLRFTVEIDDDGMYAENGGNEVTAPDVKTCIEEALDNYGFETYAKVIIQEDK